MFFKTTQNKYNLYSVKAEGYVSTVFFEIYIYRYVKLCVLCITQKSMYDTLEFNTWLCIQKSVIEIPP